jgi:transposase
LDATLAQAKAAKDGLRRSCCDAEDCRGSLATNLGSVQEKTQDQLDLKARDSVRSRLVSRRTATINQIRAFLIEKGVAVRPGYLPHGHLVIKKDSNSSYP